MSHRPVGAEERREASGTPGRTCRTGERRANVARDSSRSAREVERAIREAHREIERAQRSRARNPPAHPQRDAGRLEGRGVGAGVGRGEGYGKEFIEKESKTFTVTGTPSVNLSTFDGSITIRGWDKSEVMYTATKESERSGRGQTNQN